MRDPAVQTISPCTRRPQRGDSHPRRLLQWAFWLVVFLCPPLPAQAMVKVLVISNNWTGVYQGVENAIRKQFVPACAALESGCPDVEWRKANLDNEENLRIQIAEHPGLIVTLGGMAAHWVVEHPVASPVLFTLIPHQTFEAMASSLPGGLEYSALFIDQPFDRQFKLIKYALPKRKKVGVLLGPTSSKLKPSLLEAASRNGFTLNIAVLRDKARLGRSLQRLLDVSNVLLSVPDPLVYNRRSIFSILLTTYHSRVPVVGFSKAYVKAGALIALYSSPEQIGKHTAELIATFYRDAHTFSSKNVYPRYFSVAMNANVARSLEIRLPEEDELIDLLQGADR